MVVFSAELFDKVSRQLYFYMLRQDTLDYTVPQPVIIRRKSRDVRDTVTVAVTRVQGWGHGN